jgi:hypothetical protein
MVYVCGVHQIGYLPCIIRLGRPERIRADFMCHGQHPGDPRETNNGRMRHLGRHRHRRSNAVAASVFECTGCIELAACWGLSAHTDDLGFWNLFNNFSSTSGSNRAGYKSPAMDAGLTLVRSASTDDQKKAGYKAMSEAYIKEIPMISIDALAETVASQPSRAKPSEDRAEHGASRQGLVQEIEHGETRDARCAGVGAATVSLGVALTTRLPISLVTLIPLALMLVSAIAFLPARAAARMRPAAALRSE